MINDIVRERPEYYSPLTPKQKRTGAHPRSFAHQIKSNDITLNIRQSIRLGLDTLPLVEQFLDGIPAG